ncbi:MAG: Ig-like domain-containing protein, partial [Gemmatales bacterium]|nr:cadherin-like domain-containing protein [Gemmatales bacterium]MDW8176442.1 Ig-like domain-containing protein [Gemmatales bacterium]
VAPGTLQVYATYIYPAIYHLQTGPSHGSLTFNLSNFAPPVCLCVSTPLRHGSLAFHAIGTFTYTPNQCFVGSDSFTFRWTDGIGLGNTVTVWINVYNHAPVAYAARFVVPFGT